jgi:predicted esterase YcpF (UPF0227 family)
MRISIYMIPKQLRCLYLHGFKSGPSSVKAQQAVGFFAAADKAQNIHVPQLSAEPSKAIDEAQFLYEQLIDEVGIEHVLVIGSSLGGYYASYLVEHFGGRAVVINPAVRPYDLLESYLGENENLYNGEKFTVTKDSINQLKAIDVVLNRPKHHLLLVKMQDETLDSSLAVTKYRHGPCFIEHGGDHSYHDFAKRLPCIINFVLSPY